MYDHKYLACNCVGLSREMCLNIELSERVPIEALKKSVKLSSLLRERWKAVEHLHSIPEYVRWSAFSLTSRKCLWRIIFAGWLCFQRLASGVHSSKFWIAAVFFIELWFCGKIVILMHSISHDSDLVYTMTYHDFKILSRSSALSGRFVMILYSQNKMAEDIFFDIISTFFDSHRGMYGAKILAI